MRPGSHWQVMHTSALHVRGQPHAGVPPGRCAVLYGCRFWFCVPGIRPSSARDTPDGEVLYPCRRRARMRPISTPDQHRETYLDGVTITDDNGTPGDMTDDVVVRTILDPGAAQRASAHGLRSSTRTDQHCHCGECGGGCRWQSAAGRSCFDTRRCGGRHRGRAADAQPDRHQDADAVTYGDLHADAVTHRCLAQQRRRLQPQR